MMVLLIAAVILGAVASFFGVVPEVLNANNGILVEITLYLMLFLIGFDLGNNRTSFSSMFKADKMLLIVPAGTILGTLFGGFLCASIVNLSGQDAMAVAAGFGWYSFSAVILAKVKGAELGAIAFLANVMRESLSLFLIPVIAKYLGPYAAIAPGGATTMDVTLPIIEKYAGRRAAIIGFVQGVILTGITPFVIEMIV
ncbi:lysine exporter LysO family protein [Limisalsivibrio acetivorans]|uniref:lysine exporter LysO family protein n=1 Tax=Limisalsivibrio acetivorans TaxID=1304888 RepID=UPI0003B6FB53|nr:lysine exporter LysO family protein [Limisalsivibrio acetivorans]